MQKKITTEVIIAYSLCPKKAFLLLYSNGERAIPEYSQIVQLKKESSQKSYIQNLEQQNSNVQPYSLNNLKGGSDYLTNAMINFEDMEANCGVLIKSKASSSPGKFSYEPMIFTGTQSIEKKDKLELIFTGYLLEQIQNKVTEKGIIITIDQKRHTISLSKRNKILIPVLEQLQEWSHSSSIEPPIILNKHCSYCQFQSLCTTKAKQADSLSLLDGISSSKAINKYEKKGIFTVKQLSFLFKHKRHRKDAKSLRAAAHKVELQALAIKTSQIYHANQE